MTQTDGKIYHVLGLEESVLLKWQHHPQQQIAHTAQYQKHNQPNKKMGRRPKQTFLPRRHTDGHLAHEKWLSYVRLFATPWTVARQAPLSLGFSRQEYWSGVPFPREVQIKPTMRCYLTPVKMASIKKSTNEKSWRECGEKGTLLHCWWEFKLT